MAVRVRERSGMVGPRNVWVLFQYRDMVCQEKFYGVMYEYVRCSGHGG